MPSKIGEGSTVIEMLAAIEGVSDRLLERALIQSVLVDHFGSRLVNEARFQRVVDQVVETLQHEPETRDMLGATVKALRAESR